jgi:hypothetical protein
MATAAPVHPGAPRQGVIARHPLLSFFLLTFLISWGWWALWGALQLPTPLIYVRTAGPTIAAFVVLAIISGRPGVLGLLRSYVHWRVGVQWYLLALIGVPFLVFFVIRGRTGGPCRFCRSGLELYTRIRRWIRHQRLPRRWSAFGPSQKFAPRNSPPAYKDSPYRGCA